MQFTQLEDLMLDCFNEVVWMVWLDVDSLQVIKNALEMQAYPLELCTHIVNSNPGACGKCVKILDESKWSSWDPSEYSANRVGSSFLI